MAFQAECAHVRQIAFTATFDYRRHVVGVPKTFSPTQSPFRRRFYASGSAQPFDVPQLRHAVEPANGANPAIPLENTVAQMARIAA